MIQWYISNNGLGRQGFYCWIRIRILTEKNPHKSHHTSEDWERYTESGIHETLDRMSYYSKNPKHAPKTSYTHHQKGKPWIPFLTRALKTDSWIDFD
jgi:hypothetical protein